MTQSPPTQSARGCGIFRHEWGVERYGRWWPYVPEVYVGALPPREKVCRRCNKRKPLRWRFGMTS